MILICSISFSNYLAGWLALILFGGTLVWLAHRLGGTSRHAVSDQLGRLLALIGWLIMAGTCVGITIGIFGPIAIGVWTIFAIVLALAVGKYEMSERRAFMGYLALAARRGIPMSHAARAFRAERPFPYGVRAGDIADRLDSGMPLDQAITKSRLRLPADAMVAVRLGCRTGALGPLLERTMVQPSAVQQALARFLEQLLLFSLFFFAGVSVIQFVLIKVLPTLLDLGSEPSASLPGSSWGPFFLFALMAFMHYLSSIFLVALVVSGLLTLAYLGWFRIPVPWLNRIIVRFHSAQILRILAPLVRRGDALVEILRSMSTQYPRWTVRRRLRRALKKIDSGQDWQRGLRAARLLNRREATVLRAAQRAGNLGWALDEIAATSLQRTARRIQSISDILFPILVVLGGLLVLVWGGALIGELAYLIQINA